MSLKMIRLPLQQLAAADGSGELAIADRDLAADGHDGWFAFDGPAFEGIVVEVLSLGFELP